MTTDQHTQSGESVVSYLRMWLQIQRIQTWPATMLLFATAYLLAGGDLFTVTGIALIAVTWFVHGSSFGHNVIEDYWIDKNDPAKSDHPLTSGRINYQSAVRFFGTYLFAVEAVAIGLTLWISDDPLLPMTALAIMIAAGHWYNDASFSSYSKAAFIPISITWVAFAAWGWLIVKPETTVLFLLVMAYVWFRIHFQISVSGRLKEIGVEDEANELRWLGAIVKRSDDDPEIATFTPGWAGFYAYALSLLQFLTGLAIAGHLYYGNGIDIVSAEGVALGLYTILGVIGLGLTERMMRPQMWNRENHLKQMSYIEILFIFALVLLVAPVIGYLEVIVLLSVSLAWFAVMNRYLWDTEGTHPDV